MAPIQPFSFSPYYLQTSRPFHSRQFRISKNHQPMKKILTLFIFALLFNSAKISAQCNAGFNFNIVSFTPAVVDFTDMSTDSLGTVISYAWDFGDGQTSVLQNPTHTYATQGTYNVCLTIGTSTACSDSRCKSVVVYLPPPSVVATISDTLGNSSCTAPATINLVYSGTIDGFLATDSVLVYINFGDGTDTTFYRVLGSNPHFVRYMPHTYLNAGSYNVQITITAPNGMSSTGSTGPVTIGATCGNISGKVYDDVNANCILDGGDVVLSNQIVYLYSASNFVGSAVTDINGDYSFNVLSGPVYDVHAPTSSGYLSHYSVLCPVGGVYTVSSLPSTGNDFSFTCLPDFDLQTSIYANCLRPGFIDHVYVSGFNSRCNTPSGQITVVFPPDLTPLPDSVNSYTISGNTITYQINPGDYYWSLNVPVQVNAAAPIGTNECITSTITPLAGDYDVSNNTFTGCWPLTGSFDPNVKTVDPAGVGVQGLIRPQVDLTYTIHFQNTGTASAVNVFILDTIDSDLEPGSITLLGASHDMHWSILAGNIIRFNFDNINLPDSNTNEFLSHGYVAYRISQKPSIADHSVIENTAAIYFDFNEPVITNTTLNTIDYFLSASTLENSIPQMSIYPNPVKDQCKISFSARGEKSLQIFDSTGKIILSKVTTSDQFILDTSTLSNGIYTVGLLSEEGFTSNRFLISR